MESSVPVWHLYLCHSQAPRSPGDQCHCPEHTQRGEAAEAKDSTSLSPGILGPLDAGRGTGSVLSSMPTPSPTRWCVTPGWAACPVVGPAVAAQSKPSPPACLPACWVALPLSVRTQALSLPFVPPPQEAFPDCFSRHPGSLPSCPYSQGRSRLRAILVTPHKQGLGNRTGSIPSPPYPHT